MLLIPSKLISNLALTVGYLNPALNNPALALSLVFKNIFVDNVLPIINL